MTSSPPRAAPGGWAARRHGRHATVWATWTKHTHRRGARPPLIKLFNRFCDNDLIGRSGWRQWRRRLTERQKRRSRSEGTAQSGRVAAGTGRFMTEGAGVEKASAAGEYLDLAKRIQADFDNYRKRAQRDREENVKVGQRQARLSSSLAFLDDLERALGSNAQRGGAAQGRDADTKQPTDHCCRSYGLREMP